MGRKSGRNGAPAPQSRVSLSELIPRELLYLLECVRSFLLVVPPDSQWTFQQKRTLSRSFVCAPGESREDLRARVWPRCGRKKREDCANVFATGTHGPRSGHQQDEVARIGGLPGEARCVHSRVYADAEEA